MQDPYGALIALVRFDNEINLKKQLILQHAKALEVIQQGISLFKDKIARDQEELKSLEKRQGAIDLDLLVCEEEAARIATRLDSAKGVKEFDALVHERDQVETRNEALEQEIESIWSTIGQIEEQIVQHEREMLLFTKNNQADLVSLRESIETLERLINEALQRRPEMVSVVRPEWYEQYERMRGQITKPFVPLSETGSCSGCGSSVSHVDRAAVDRHVLTPCQVCRRILYDDRVSE